MSNDLISRKALMEGRVENDPVRIAAMCAPTAYDVDAVCDQIQNVPHGYLNCETEEEILEIVRNGGKRE